jgi:hypothetical protein
MIMVSNKKTEKQMAEDLELFLGGSEQAIGFSSWLHSTIRSWTSSKDGNFYFFLIYKLNHTHSSTICNQLNQPNRNHKPTQTQLARVQRPTTTWMS